ncbi:hypothetical protein [Variovorax sp. PMC12]|uniref:hypothetical protein n=1 Tax=Variovorax sp. PMC12 TaxID=2126319 RepID=UPI000D13BD16|nr:hypothetical protein [Variovorax sp. PMC12]AVQ80730.1 hypothetical protein C4F17_07080 [Variovorax sp. PMC12]
MFAGIRKTLSNAASRIATAFKGLGALIVDDLEVAPETPPLVLRGPKVVPFEAPSKVYRLRTPNSNREARRKAGLPHGTSGAKLIRRAAERRLTLRGQDVATYAA